MTAESVKEELFRFISDELEIEEISSIEYNGGGNIWIDLKDGSTYSLALTDVTEKE